MRLESVRGLCQGDDPLRRAVAAFCVLTLGTWTGAPGAEERLPEVVVTAPPPVDTTPAPRDPTAFATVIETREAPTTVDTLSRVLSDAVGVQVRRFGGLGDFSTVSIRGFSPGQVQVYLDGVPLSRADNETVNLSDLPLDAVDHVEVYRTTTPLAFAQSAPGGVVNVVTRRGPVAGASASYGSFETRKTTLAYGRTRGAWDGLVFAQYLGSKGDFTFTDDVGTDDPADDRTLTRINNAFDQGDLTARLAYRSAPFTLAFTTDGFAKSQGVPGRVAPQSQTAHRDTNRELAQVDLDVAPTALPLGLTASVYGLHQAQSFTASGDRAFVPTDVRDRTITAGGQVLARGAIGTSQVPALLLAGSAERFVQENAIGRFGVLSPGTSPPQTRARFTLGAEDQIVALGERLSVVPGVRWEVYHDVFPGDPHILVPALQVSGTSTRDFVLPRLGVRGDVGYGVTLLGNAARSARMPNLTELFGNSGTVRGNPELQPETAVTWDAGFQARPPWTNRVVTAVFLEFAYFSADVDDLITLVPSSVNVFVPTNIGAATIRGQEVSARVALWDRLLATANYTHQNARDEGAESFARGNQLPGRPANEVYGRLELVWSDAQPLPGPGAGLWPGSVFFDLDLIADNFLDRANLERVPSRTLYGVGFAVVVPRVDVRLAWEMRNFTDDQTEDVLGFPLPGRSMFVTASYGFGPGEQNSH